MMAFVFAGADQRLRAVLASTPSSRIASVAWPKPLLRVWLRLDAGQPSNLFAPVRVLVPEQWESVTIPL
jgi:hypothetical protein